MKRALKAVSHVALAALATLALAASASAQTPFAITQFTAGVSTSIAGAHPDATTSFLFPLGSGPGGVAAAPRDITVNLPPGLLGDATAVPQCPGDEFENYVQARADGCAPETQAGISRVLINGGTVSPLPVYSLKPRAGEVARFGFSVAQQRTYIDVTVRTASDYGITATVSSIPALGFYGATLTLWGVPADPSHDPERAIFCGTGASCEFGASSNAPVKALLTNPTTCPSSPPVTTLSVVTYEHPDEPLTASAQSPPTTGCEGLAFDPSIALAPETTEADSPSGYEVDLSVPQDEDPAGRAVSQLRTAVVTLPAGVSIDPSVANGLQACSDAGFGMGETAPPSCPQASILGSTEIDTPVLPEPLYGHAFVGAPLPGNTYRLFLEAHGDSLEVKLEGTVTPDPSTGQLTATFDDLPQAPFGEFKLRLKGGDTAPLATPPVCGEGALASALTPWSGNLAAMPGSLLSTDFDGHGGACPTPLPLAPAFAAGSGSLVAGAPTSFSLTLSRPDRSEYLGRLGTHLPPGLLAHLAGIPLCPAARAAAGTCEASSQVGTVTAAAGAGATPFTLPGTVYLAQPRSAASPASLSVAIPVIAGPFDLGEVVVTADVVVNSDGSVTVSSDPFPTIVQGVPVRLRQVTLNIDRPGFMVNPTSCDRMAVGATVTSTQGQSANVSSPFQLADCASLGFSPSFTASTVAHTSKRDGASLDVKVVQTPGQANIHRVDVQLPLALPSRLTTLQHACPAAQFASNPAGCPQGSDVGVATAVTPLLANPLVGPAFLVSHGGAAFPDLVIVLQGEGITIDLTGNTDIKKGITYSRFETVPDAPISSFELKLPEGPSSVLAADLPLKANGSMCGQALMLPTTIAGQNGDAVTQRTKVTVAGCKASKPLTRIQLLAKALKRCEQIHKRSKLNRVACDKRARKIYAAGTAKKVGARTIRGKEGM